MYCPFFERKGVYCKAYSLGIRIPEPYEVDHFCAGGSYKFCCWYSGTLNKKEVMDEFKNFYLIKHVDKEEQEETINS